MIRVELAEQTAVEVHHALTVLRDLLTRAGLSDAETAVRDTQLAVAGGLRAAGWAPVEGGWAKAAPRARR